MAEQAPAQGTPQAGTAQPPAASASQGAEAASPDQLVAADIDATAAAAATEPGNTDGQADAAPEGAPETYADFKLPEGVEMDTAALEIAVPFFQKAGFTQERAQEAIDLWVQLGEAGRQRVISQQQALVDGWRKEIDTDPNIGGAKLGTPDKPGPTRVAWSKAIDRLAGGDAKEAAAIRQALIETGAGGHPAFARAFARLGTAVAEPGEHLGGDPPAPPAKKDPPGKIYPNMPRQRTR